jgi:FkbM family methyltransferase
MPDTKKNNIKQTKKSVKKAMQYTGKKSLNKKGVWREIEFPLSKKSMYVPDTPDTKNSVVAQAHLKGRKWEPKIAAILTKHCKKGTTAVDMGAYIGTHTMSLVDGVGPKGNVITFEPQPWAYKGIKKTLSKNNIKNVKVVNAGLSDKKGKIQFCSDGSGSSSVCNERSASKKKWAEVYDIPIVTLDSYNLKNVSIMKVDVEGHELNALNGAKKTIISSNPVIVLEVWRKRTNRLQKIKDFMKSVNYSIKHISADDFICFPK